MPSHRGQKRAEDMGPTTPENSFEERVVCLGAEGSHLERWPGAEPPSSNPVQSCLETGSVRNGDGPPPSWGGIQ